ncbi:protein of unknown function [Cupriavidus taiwanensis]|nr:protein of unknown function [Cupriavidus taiwanensis]
MHRAGIDSALGGRLRRGWLGPGAGLLMSMNMVMRMLVMMGVVTLCATVASRHLGIAVAARPVHPGSLGCWACHHWEVRHRAQRRQLRPSHGSKVKGDQGENQRPYRSRVRGRPSPGRYATITSR